MVDSRKIFDLLNDRLDVLMNVVMNMLTSNSWGNGCSVMGLPNSAGVLELSALGLKSLLHVSRITVLNVLVLNSTDVVGVLLWCNLSVLNWLDGSVVVILVDFTIDGSGSLLVSGLCNILVHDGWVDYEN